MLGKLRGQGQSTLEYAMIIAVVVGALIAMQIYMKRGLQGKLRESSDDIGKQFEAAATKVNNTTTRTSKTIETTANGGTYIDTGSKAGTAEKTTFRGTEEVSAWTVQP